MANLSIGLSAVATGTADVITATFSPAITLSDRRIVFLRVATPNTTTTPTFNPNSLGAQVVKGKAGVTLKIGELTGDCILMYHVTGTYWEVLNSTPFLDARSSIQTQLDAATSSLGSPLNIINVQTHTGITAETIMPIDCPNLVGVLATGDILNLMLYLQATNSANLKTVKFYISDSKDVLLNEVLIGTGTGTNQFINTARIEKIMLMTSLTTQLVVSGTTTGIAGWGIVMTGLSIDFSSGTKYLCITYQLAVGSETMKLQFAFSQINRKF